MGRTPPSFPDRRGFPTGPYRRDRLVTDPPVVTYLRRTSGLPRGTGTIPGGASPDFRQRHGVASGGSSPPPTSLSVQGPSPTPVPGSPTVSVRRPPVRAYSPETGPPTGRGGTAGGGGRAPRGSHRARPDRRGGVTWAGSRPRRRPGPRRTRGPGPGARVPRVGGPPSCPTPTATRPRASGPAGHRAVGALYVRLDPGATSRVTGAEGVRPTGSRRPSGPPRRHHSHSGPSHRH